MAGFDPHAYLSEDDAPAGGAPAFDPHAYLAEGTPAAGPKIEAPGASAVFSALKDGGPSAAWGVMKQNKAAYDQERATGVRPEPVAGNPPMAIPAGALGAFGRAAVALGEGQGLGYAAGRTALSAAQGAGMSAFDGEPGESWQDKIDRAKSGAKLAGGIQLAVESVPYVGKALGYVSRKIGSAVSGVPEDVIKHYADRTDQVNQLIKESDGNMTEAADKVRQELSQGIQKTKATLNGQISQALEAAPKAKTIDLDPILSPLEKQHAALVAKNQTAEADQVRSIIDKVKQFGVDKDSVYGVEQYTGKASPKDLHNIKGLLQDIAAPAYQQNGQIFNYAKSSQQAAKYGAAAARKAVNAAVPEVAAANNQLSAMHTIEGNLNRNLLAAGKPDSALFAAASGANPRNQKMLESLGNIAGVDTLGRAKDLAAARTFANPGMLPTDATGKAAGRMLLAGGIGHAVAGPFGYAAGALASPAVVKGAINVANVAGKAAAAAGIPTANQFVRANPFAAQAGVQLAANQLRRANTDNPMTSAPPSDQELAPPALMQNDKAVNRSPSKEDQWAQSGAKNLGLEDDVAAKALQDPRGRQLLIQASSHKPGSRAAKQIMDQIQKGWGGK